MHTERIYFADAYLIEFDGRVVERRERNGRIDVALDRSAFYPEGGGQPADRGTLNDVPVSDVQVEDGVVWHTLAAPLGDDSVNGIIDWTRRFDHMQQHHGQHLLSAAFERLYGLRTVSFHLGPASSTIDLDAASMSPEQLYGAEALVNQVIWEDRPVLARFVSSEELATITLRKAPTVSGPIRVVSVPEFDDSACGGTHPRATGGVGLLRVKRSERRGDVTRVEFLCGGRALRDYQVRDQAVAQLASQFSVGADEVVAAVARLRETEERARKRLEVATQALIGVEAEALAQGALVVGGERVVRQAFDGRPIEEVRLLAAAIAGAGCVALLGTAADRAQLVFARPTGSSLDCGALLKQTLATFGGRGGGQPALAQGGLPDRGMLPEALDAAVARMAR